MSFPRYPKYKDSGVKWLGEVPEGWTPMRLKFLLLDGYDGMKIGPFGSQLTSEMLDDQGLYKVYGQENVISKDFQRGSRFIGDDKFQELSVYEIRPGDLLVTMMGTSGRCDVVPDDVTRGIMDSHLLRVRLRSVVRGDFVRMLIDEAVYVGTQVQLTGKGSIMHGLNSSVVKDLLLVVPPVEEQNQILAFLDREIAKIDALVAEQRRLIDLLKEKRQAVISHTVTKGLNPHAPLKPSGIEWLGDVPAHWEVISIKWLSTVKRGASPRPIDDPKYFDDQGEFAWVRIADVSASDGVLRETTQRLSDLGSSLSVKIAPGELFVSIAGTVGKPCMSAIKACIHDGFVYFPTLRIDPKFLYRIFEAGTCYGGLGKWGTQLNLNTDTIGSIRIALPPVEELGQVLVFLDTELAKLDALTAEAEHAIMLLEERRTALISDAVTGKIDVRGLVGTEAA